MPRVVASSAQSTGAAPPVPSSLRNSEGLDVDTALRAVMEWVSTR